ncbi:anthranilate synthase component II [Corynebacterium kutscheri]|uniref:anthranilate synthase n=1 Tax=Corynebacterium kutscheri TaxID=35755 RepID=A0A0F6TEP7_9CORY|nr:anthranilate synthase component II [Corynebacterium kutscheri]AKE42264.1 anthranilate/para-aminobenzoate synthase component II [Corynebacterium kutscheri]VEH05650.1 anthranilate synthase component II [Corynebacterium kutscheri]VEH10608.1 anthranilate synthase component II [Corynebacterium kutscheri]VEH81544.1 anthranilate synthase component II [Corynebacterium kutscheri]
MSRNDIHVVLIDNRDSFVYNLVDAFAVAGYRCTVFRNNVTVTKVLEAQPSLICLSPGPGHPQDAGYMMEIINATIGRIPLLGICLGFQALLEHFGGTVEPCGPVHGTTDIMRLTTAGCTSPIFTDLRIDANPENNFRGNQVPIARYHSLGCTSSPSEFIDLAYCDSEIGEVVMAAELDREKIPTISDGIDAVDAIAGAIGLQFHPESVLSPTGPIILDRCIDQLLSTISSKG